MSFSIGKFCYVEHKNPNHYVILNSSSDFTIMDMLALYQVFPLKILQFPALTLWEIVSHISAYPGVTLR